MLILMAFYEVFNNCQYYEVLYSPVDLFITFARFICSTILHLSLIDEVSHGLEMMKYSCNHRYKFKVFWIAWLSGFFQALSCLTVEMANIFVLCCANDTIDIVFNFIALAIIADFDNYVFQSMKGEGLRELIVERFTKKVLRVEHTTSKKCRVEERTGIWNEEKQEFRKLKIQFSERPIVNKLFFSLYKVLKTFYISVFFYYMPFLSIILSSLLPLLMRAQVPNFPNCPGLN